MLGGLLTLDDFFVWSTKVQSVEAKVVEEKVLLVAFPALTYYLAEFDEFSTASNSLISGVSEEEKDGAGKKPSAFSFPTFSHRAVMAAACWTRRRISRAN